MTPEPRGGNPIPAFTAQDLDDSLNALFSGELDFETRAGIHEGAVALVNLLNIFIVFTAWKPLYRHAQVEDASVELLLRRYYRDAFGVKKYDGYINGLVAAGKISSDDAKEIRSKVRKLGLRITSDDPRKTKVVAAFALWFSTFRPVFFLPYGGRKMPNHTVQPFCACFNYWVTTRYLRKFGRIELGEIDGHIRLERFQHDLTYRAVNLSSLEFFYASIFRAGAAN